MQWRDVISDCVNKVGQWSTFLFFREKALFFEKNGKYTNLIPNGNPKSEYAKFWKDELHKCKYGQVRPDGEWIPGELYFYWNFTQIPLTEKDKNSKSKK